MKKTLEAISLTILAALFIGLGAFSARAALGDPELEAGVIRVINSGLMAFKLSVNSSGHLVLLENTTTGAAALTINGTDGSVKFKTRTAAQLLTDVPNSADELVINSSSHDICISTGTGAGAWAYVSTTTKTGLVAYVPCGKT